MNWWDKNYKRSDFRGWIAQDSNSTRKRLAELVKPYGSVLDCACGTCMDYFEYKSQGIPIKYKGVDFCEGLVEEAKEKGIDCVHGSIEELPFKDKSFDIVTARHIRIKRG